MHQNKTFSLGPIFYDSCIFLKTIVNSSFCDDKVHCRRKSSVITAISDRNTLFGFKWLTMIPVIEIQSWTTCRNRLLIERFSVLWIWPYSVSAVSVYHQKHIAKGQLLQNAQGRSLCGVLMRPAWFCIWLPANKALCDLGRCIWCALVAVLLCPVPHASLRLWLSDSGVGTDEFFLLGQD